MQFYLKTLSGNNRRNEFITFCLCDIEEDY